jgi:alkanesulfonate monooxygenase SsuD/methylene tetrahydromethanopterin reductase-like flavin-dependent oxidoreductase (luciferase family)
MKVNVSLASNNSKDWERVQAKDFSRPPIKLDHECVGDILALGDLVEPLGFDGIWVTEHNSTPLGQTPNPLQLLTYFAARTKHISLGTMVVVTPWWNPIRLAHQIAYLDIISNGRYDTIGLGRGVSKTEFDAVGVSRDEARTRYAETLDILELAFTKERFSYEGEIYKIPEMSIRPAPRSGDLVSRFYGGASSGPSLEINARRGLKPLFVGNKPISEAGKEVLLVNTIRQEVGLPPCQPKNVLFMYCTPTQEGLKRGDDIVAMANRDVMLHYGFGDPKNFAGVKGYESYAAGAAAATAPTAAAVTKPKEESKQPSGYHQSNLIIGPPDAIIEKIAACQKACSFSEMTIIPSFGDMNYDEARKSLELFAKEVLPAVHKMDAPLHASVVPAPLAQHA